MRFTEWFRFEPIAVHQKAVLAADFMEFLAPVHWPPEARAGFCWLPENSAQTDCKMKEGVITFVYTSLSRGANFDRESASSLSGQKLP